MSMMPPVKTAHCAAEVLPRKTSAASVTLSATRSAVLKTPGAAWSIAAIPAQASVWSAGGTFLSLGALGGYESWNASPCREPGPETFVRNACTNERRAVAAHCVSSVAGTSGTLGRTISESKGCDPIVRQSLCLKSVAGDRRMKD